MKIDRIIAMTVILLALMPGLVLACDDVPAQSTRMTQPTLPVLEDGVATMYQIGVDAAKYAMGEMGFERGDAHVLALTNAGYPVINGQTTEICLYAVMEVTGCNPGKGNLVNIQSHPWKPLWFGFYDKRTGEAVYMKVKDDGTGFAVQEGDKIDAETVLADVAGWDPGVFDHMLPIANIWAHEKTPYIFMKGVEHHNHVCPGITSGLLLANYVEDRLPIEDATNQSYKVISCSACCKDDYFVKAWDSTTGKKGMYATHLTADERNALREKYGVIADRGIFIRWDASSKTGDGLALGLEYPQTEEGWPRWAARLQQNIIMMDAADTPETFVSTIKEFSLANEDELLALQGAGVHPLKVLGIMSG